ncbi:hypothetical protein GCM10028773_14320 [Spirosoma koreense]
MLDLSDRLLIAGQPQRDMALIQTAFNQFEQRVRQQLIINSADRFRVVIAPQRNVTYDAEEFMNGLYLDMSRLKLAEKRKQLDAIHKALPGQLTKLYAQATAGRSKTRDFAGCDLWQYANEQLPTDLDPAYDNCLLVLTDGYFDFEHNTHGLTQGNRATDARVLDRLRKDPTWRQTLTLPTEGLLPITKPLPNLSVCVAEIQPKYDRLEETELLVAVWQKWLQEMRVKRRQCQLRSSLPKSLASLTGFLSP